MEKQEKTFILNKGLILGLVLIFFPIIDLMYGLNMSLTIYFTVFGLFWIILYSYLIVKWGKELASYYEEFSFKDAFRTLFLITALSSAILTVGKIAIWNVSYPEKYIELQENFYNNIFSNIVQMVEEQNKELLRSGDISSDEYENEVSKLENLENESFAQAKNAIELMKKEGIGATFFIGKLIYRLFFFAIYCAILALFVRKKEKFIKTN